MQAEGRPELDHHGAHPLLPRVPTDRRVEDLREERHEPARRQDEWTPMNLNRILR
jgi:hypothetical protein